MSKTYEMMWDCSYCDTKKLLENHTNTVQIGGTAQDPTKDTSHLTMKRLPLKIMNMLEKTKCAAFCEAQFGFGKICTECAGPMDGTKDVQLVNEDPAPASDTPKPETQKKVSNKMDRWNPGVTRCDHRNIQY